MELGNKITELRKKSGLSQEELAEKIGVTRQTISKWELGETVPDINQAIKMSKIFKISLDELTNNDINNIIVEKVSNTEKLAGIVIKLLKYIGIAFVALLIIDIIVFVIFFISNARSNDSNVVDKYSLACTLDNNEYLYELEYNKNFQIINAGGDAFIANHTEVENYDDANKAKSHIEDWFNEHNGSCDLKKD